MDAGRGGRLVASLRAAPPWEHGCENEGLVETHLSWVLLAGPYAYKIKKPVDFGFVDFTTLERRRHFLEEELRLNRRLSDGWYLAVIPFHGAPERPLLTDDGAPPFEYGLMMRRFPQSALLSANAGVAMDEPLVEQLADRVAAFHRSPDAAVAADDTPYGAPETVREMVEGNFVHIRALLPDGLLSRRVQRLHEREGARFEAFREMLAMRKATGRIRELHGDLHRGNIAIVDGAPLLFDALEFNPSFRWIDPMAEDYKKRLSIAAAYHFAVV
ncbi:MAG: hypothetical protein HQK87_07070, partial [Nitrospinae bacterium]|nr:hypothetical protein [Nitrospinota bacterium]